MWKISTLNSVCILDNVRSNTIAQIAIEGCPFQYMCILCDFCTPEFLEKQHFFQQTLQLRPEPLFNDEISYMNDAH